MEAHQSSMRLKQPSPVGSICTRSQSQIHLHPNRSGQARISQGHPNFPTYEPQRKRNRSVDPITEASLDNSLILKILSKDLRVKRIFSPFSRPSETATDNQSCDVEFTSHEKEDCPKAAEKSGVEISGSRLIPSGRDMDVSESIKTHKSEMGFVFGAQKPDTTSLQSPVSNVSGGRLLLVDQSGGGPNQECAQKISPEVKEKCVRLDQNETKKVLKPRQRVFKPPGSFSYRRLLPYLRNVAKDNSCVLDFFQELNIVKGLDGKPFQGIRAPENQEGSLYQYDEIKLSSECCASGSSTPLENVQVSSHETSNGNEPSSESPEYVPKSPPITFVDECLPKAPVDGQTSKFEMLNCPPFSSSVIEDPQVNKDHIIDVEADDKKAVAHVEPSDKAINGSSWDAEHAKGMNSISPSMTGDCYLCKDDAVAQNCEKSNQSQSEGMIKIDIDMEYPCKNENPNHLNEQRVSNACLVLNQGHDSKEESLQMTPPDAEILGKLKVEVKRISRTGYDLQTTGPSNGFNQRDATCDDVRTNESTPKRKMVLNPFSRLKLFRSPGSVSYRRLLPYLMDMKKYNSCGNNTGKDLEHGLLPSLTPNQQATPMDESKGSRFLSDHQICEPGTLPTPQITSASGSLTYSGENLTSPECVTESRMSIGLQKEQHVEQAASDNKHLDIMSLGHDTEGPATLLCPSTSEATLIKLGTLSVANSLWDDEKPVQADSLCQNSPQIAASVSSGIPAVGLRKQILKRNPRGCRGLCTCLNCASFRLHAERAFEFSRNQMQDAEELAFNLMKELSNLRKMIEMSAVGENNRAMDLNEVKEACRKASETEDVARSRIDEMNNDLNIHCRIKCLHGPKVTFANFIEEKFIPEANFSRN